MNFAVPFNENIKQDKCTRIEDARPWRTSVIDTKNTRVWSKIPVFAIKMLKIRKKCLARSFS